MNGRDPVGAFPQTPVAGFRKRVPATAAPGGTPTNHNATTPPPTRNPLPVAQQQGPTGRAGNAPVIPLNVIDAPTQRLYAVAIYLALGAWKIYDWAQLVEEDTESFWLFLKWIAIDCIFLFGLPELRIPWLELSQPFVVAAFFCHAIFDWMLMFNIGLPWQTWLFGFVKVFYDRELAISEHQVKVSSIIHNSSLIMGKQVINILPEGSAVLNPEAKPFCLGGDRVIAQIPMFFNATIPIEAELIRTDLETNQQETIKLTKAQLREIKQLAKKQASQDGADDVDETIVQYAYPAKKPGVYRLGKVLDEYKLEVQRRTPLTFVVPCPRASIAVSPSSAPGRCVGDLSDLSLFVDGTPPLKVVYGRTIEGKDRSFHFQSLQPDDFTSPLSGASGTVVGASDEDVSWARSQRVTVSLNESMSTSGHWQYSVDEVHDAFGNIIKYVSPNDDPEGKPKPKHLVQNLVVKERPRVWLEGCDSRNPLKVAKGESKSLPVKFNIPGRMLDDTSHSLTWQFSPIDSLTKSGDHGDVVTTGSYDAKTAKDQPRISAPGLYTLKSVTAGSCEGEVQEPSSCLLLNPLEPKLTLRTEEIPDTCAGNSIGLRVDMDLIGTPPFEVHYKLIANGGPAQNKRITVHGLRYQQEFIPKLAGYYKYVFTHIGDKIYPPQKLPSSAEYTLEQDVKPAAAALIQHSSGQQSACLGDEASVDILLIGDPPFTLEWEVIHDGKRKQLKEKGIDGDKYTIQTGALNQGGEYTLALTSVMDKRGCKSFVQDELKISVRRQSPRAAFGLVEGKRKVMAVESATVNLPLRLTGEGPWRVWYQNLEEEGAKPIEKKVSHDNDVLPVSNKGVFAITDVWDKQCHGKVDAKANKFEVGWFKRPELAVVVSHGIREVDTVSGRKEYVVDDVCEGDVSGFEVQLKGTPPYHVDYEVRHKPISSHASSRSESGALSRRSFDAASSKAPIHMDTAKAGTYTYQFSSLSDELYNSDKRAFKGAIVKQKVNGKPSAAFVKPGQTFKYCKLDPVSEALFDSESETSDAKVPGEEKIPIMLTGVPPFSIEVEIKHQTSPVPEVYKAGPISSHSYEIVVPRRLLKLGTQQVRIRSVKDGSGCQSNSADSHALAVAGAASSGSQAGAGQSVQIQMYDPPSIYPLETRTDYCVGERLSYTLSGTPPFEVWYTFDGVERKAKSPTTSFRRIAETPGEFVITTVSDKASECRAPVGLAKMIHPMPAVRISKGRNVQVDIHEGGEVDIVFEFYGTPPFEFTWTRSTNPGKGGHKGSKGSGGKKGDKGSVVLETRHDISYDSTKTIRVSQEGTYEVVAIKDRFCSFSTAGPGVTSGSAPAAGAAVEGAAEKKKIKGI